LSPGFVTFFEYVPPRLFLLSGEFISKPLGPSRVFISGLFASLESTTLPFCRKRMWPARVRSGIDWCIFWHPSVRLIFRAFLFFGKAEQIFFLSRVYFFVCSFHLCFNPEKVFPFQLEIRSPSMMIPGPPPADSYNPSSCWH